MTDWRRPLLVVADEERPEIALRRGLSLARTAGVPLTLLSVTPELPAEARRVLPRALAEELLAALRTERERRVESFISMAENDGVPLEVARREGVPFLAAVREVLRGGHDLLLKAAGERGEGGNPFGATDRHLIRKCPCALWLDAAADGAPARRVLAAVDPDPDEPQQLELSDAVLRAAVSAAALDGARLDALHAWEVFGERILRGPQTHVSDPEVDQIVGSLLNRHAVQLDALVDRCQPDMPAAHRHVLRGTPAEVIAGFVQREGVDLLVMGSVGRSGIAGMLIGNTAERVTAEVRCSLLALKPAGFVSPVPPDA